MAREFNKIALKLLQEAGQLQAPIDIEAVAISLGARVSYEPFDEDLSGILVKEPSRIVIGVNSAHPKTRQRFTIAHEIAHLALKHEGELFVDQAMKSRSLVMKRDGKSALAIDRQEIEANQFAAELLMPESLVLAAVKKRQDKGSTDFVATLAFDFQVSTKAMEYRLTNLGLYMLY